jgi:hypothetical protein
MDIEWKSNAVVCIPIIAFPLAIRSIVGDIGDTRPVSNCTIVHSSITNARVCNVLIVAISLFTPYYFLLILHTLPQFLVEIFQYLIDRFNTSQTFFFVHLSFIYILPYYY